VALRDGCSLRRTYGYSCGSGRQFEHYHLRHPDGRIRAVAWANWSRVRDAGLIEVAGEVPYDGEDREVHQVHEWTLTEAGRVQAAALPQMPSDELFAPYKKTPKEKLDRARARRHMAKILTVLTFNSARIRGRSVMFPGAGAHLQSPYASSLRSDIPDDVMALMAPHLEAFADVDGKESLRISEDGIAATAKRVR
jgi:hypothetical protein